MDLESLAGVGHVIRKFRFHPVNEKKKEVVMQENEMIRSVFQRHTFTGNCKREVEDWETRPISRPVQPK